MSPVEERLAARGWVLPPPLVPPAGTELPFQFVRVVGDRALISGHVPQRPDGAIAGPFGRLGADVTVEDGYALAQLTALSILGSLKRSLGDLDRIVCWTRVFGMVNAVPGFEHQASVVNGFSHAILDLFGREIGSHARSAVGMAALPFNVAVEIEAEVILQPHQRAHTV